MEHIERTAPKAIVVLTGAGEFGALTTYLEHYYVEAHTVDDNTVYLRMDIK
jgi:hypothetical protein